MEYQNSNYVEKKKHLHYINFRIQNTNFQNAENVCGNRKWKQAFNQINHVHGQKYILKAIQGKKHINLKSQIKNNKNFHRFYLKLFQILRFEMEANFWYLF